MELKRLFICAVILCIASAFTIDAQKYYGRVSDPDGYTNIRTGPSTSYPITRTYQSGHYLYYTPQSNGWSKVYSGERSSTFMGYMYSNRIVRVNPNSSASASSGLRYGTIVDPRDNYVNVRKGPGTKYAIVTQLWVGTKVYFESGSGWVRVYNTSKQYLGYVYRDRIR